MPSEWRAFLLSIDEFDKLQELGAAVGSTFVDTCILQNFGENLSGFLQQDIHGVLFCEAVTHFQILRYDEGKDCTLIRVRIDTGRTHQIRVHMASLQHPLLGDEVYGPAKSPFKLQGQTLHAKIIGIKHPRSGEYIEADAPLPEYFVSLLEKLENIK